MAITTAYEARGMSCVNLTEVGLHEPGWNTDIQSIRERGYGAPYSRTWTRPDVMIVEHVGEPFPKQVTPGDLLIRMERAP